MAVTCQQGSCCCQELPWLLLLYLLTTVLVNRLVNRTCCCHTGIFQSRASMFIHVCCTAAAAIVPSSTRLSVWGLPLMAAEQRLHCSSSCMLHVWQGCHAPTSKAMARPVRIAW